MDLTSQLLHTLQEEQLLKRKRMGHAGAIVMGTYGSAESKVSMFNKANIPVAKRPAEVPVLLAGKMGKSD